MDAMKIITEGMIKEDRPEFNVGDTVRVSVRIKEGERERIQAFEGTVIAKKHGGVAETFTVRRTAYGVGIERVFPVNSPFVEKVEVVRKGRVRRAKLFYLRERTGKAAKVKEQLRLVASTKRDNVTLSLFSFIIDERKVWAMERKQSKENALFEWYDSLVFALAVIVLFFMFVVRIITVSGVSMQPTLYGGDRVAVQSAVYAPARRCGGGGRLHQLRRPVGQAHDCGGRRYVLILISSQALCTRNGAVLEEPYISAPTTTGYDVEFPVTVPQGSVFVMGDNRPARWTAVAGSGLH